MSKQGKWKLNLAIKVESEDHEKALMVLSESLIKLGKAISPSSFFLPTPEVHLQLNAEIMDLATRFLNIIIPRGLAKTTLAAVMQVIHHILFHPADKKVIVIISKTQTHAKNILQSVKDIFDHSMPFRALFGYWGEHSATTWSNDFVMLKDGTAVMTRGTGQTIRGINVKLARPTLIIVDDPEDENNTKTMESMEKNLLWLLQAVVPAINKMWGRIVVIGTPLHERCIVEVLKEMKSWRTVFYGNSLDDGVALWPENQSLAELRRIRDEYQDNGRVHVYYQEYECKIIPGIHAFFPEDKIQYYDDEAYLELSSEGEHFLRFPSGLLLPVRTYMGIDPASSITAGRDYSTIVPIAVDKDRNIYVLDYFRKRVTPLDLANSIENFYLMVKPHLTLIESNSYQEMLRQFMKTKMFIPGLEYKETARTNKSNRLEMLQPFVAQGKLFIKKAHKELFEELIAFPKTKHDDLLDGLYYAVKRMKPANHNIPQEEKQELSEWKRFLTLNAELSRHQDSVESIPTYYDPFS